MQYTFAVVGTPVPQGSHRIFRNRIVPVNADALYAWRKEISTAAMLALPTDWDPALPMSVHAIFSYLRPPSHFSAKGTLRGHAPKEPVGRSDLDKLARALGDALQSAHAVNDDSQIIEFLVRKCYAAKEGVAVSIAAAGSGPRYRCACIACSEWEGASRTQSTDLASHI